MKNIRNNLLNKKRFVFPEFACNDFKINCQGGYIHWDDLYDGYDKDKELKSDLRKAQKLSDLALHPGEYQAECTISSTIHTRNNNHYISKFFQIEKMLPIF